MHSNLMRYTHADRTGASTRHRLSDDLPRSDLAAKGHRWSPPSAQLHGVLPMLALVRGGPAVSAYDQFVSVPRAEVVSAIEAS